MKLKKNINANKKKSLKQCLPSPSNLTMNDFKNQLILTLNMNKDISYSEKNIGKVLYPELPWVILDKLRIHLL